MNQGILEDILFLDIETVPQYENYDAVPERLRKLWDHKAQFISREENDPRTLYPRAGIYAEFGKIICISAGFLHRNGKEYHLRIKSFYGHDEEELLNNFRSLVVRNFNEDKHLLCAHNGKEFDFPYLCRRMVIKGVELPDILDLSGKKPWEVRHLDTMQLWKFGDFKSYTSLDLLAACLDIPTPKDDLDGSMIYPVYYRDGDLERIREYCQKDVLTLCNIVMRFNQLPILNSEHITIAK